MIDPVMMSTTRERGIFLSAGNSSGMRVTVAPALLPMPRARCPATRPMATTRNQRPVVLASVIRFETIWVPRERAVSKPKVGIPSGRGRSLSMVLGTWTKLMLSPSFFFP